MSKNIYRVNKKINLNKIIEENYFKPICVIFTKKSTMGVKYEVMQTELMKVAKVCTYAMIILVDFDNFIDYNDTYSKIKETVPCSITYFKLKPILNINGLDDTKFLMEVISKINDVHDSYVGELVKHFVKQPTEEEEQTAPQQQTTHATTVQNVPQQQVVPDEQTDNMTTPSCVIKNERINGLLQELENLS